MKDPIRLEYKESVFYTETEDYDGEAKQLNWYDVEALLKSGNIVYLRLKEEKI